MARDVDYFHLSGATLEIGSVILPGNWGRILRFYGWKHNEALKEMALEYARRERFPTRPSRLECAFVFLQEEDARRLRTRIAAFNSHLLYRVRLVTPTAAFHISDTRLSGPQGSLRDNWPDVYWEDFNPETISIPGIDNWAAATANLIQECEMLTLSPLRVVESLS